MRIILALLAIAVFAWADAYDDGLAAAKRGDYQEAIRQFTQAIEIDPNSAAYNDRGIVYVALGDYSNEIADYTQAIEIDPKYTSAYNNRGISYAKLGDFKNAAEDAHKACDLGDCKLLQLLEKEGLICD
ncbi:hypothetical protein AGMMS49521_2930 [Campylobacterota bacterium]|nr:hypothetical protein AGMMS49521_2930 [Campylobacterota bacterium]